MLVSAIENTYILLLTLKILLSVSFLKIVNAVRNNPLVVFSLLFSIFFSFSVGLTTANFGSLVRYRIPSFPFYLGALLMIQHLTKKVPEHEDVAAEFKTVEEALH
jgi:hypothetical protein